MSRVRGFERRLLAIAAAALVLRVLYVLFVAPGPSNDDASWYHRAAALLADGRGYLNPFELLGPHHTLLPTAMHPPLWPFLLALFTKLGVNSYAHQQLVNACVGVLVVVVVGLLGRRVAGDRVGLVAACLAAVYPLLVIADGSMMSESLYGLLIALALLLAYRLIDQPAMGTAALLGAAIGLAALTRTEALLLLPLLLLPLVRRLGVGQVAVACAALVLVVAPWTVRNWIVFDQPVLISTNDSTVLAGANCPAAYSGNDIGRWIFFCLPRRERVNEAQEATLLRRDGIHYARDHSGRLPAVLGARFLRTWDLFQPFRLMTFKAPPQPYGALQKAAIVAFWLVALLAIAGLVLLRRRGRALLPLIAPLAMVTLASLIGYGDTRLRHAAEIPLIVLAAVALERGASRYRPTTSSTR